MANNQFNTKSFFIVLFLILAVYIGSIITYHFLYTQISTSKCPPNMINPESCSCGTVTTKDRKGCKQIKCKEDCPPKCPKNKINPDSCSCGTVTTKDEQGCEQIKCKEDCPSKTYFDSFDDFLMSNPKPQVFYETYVKAKNPNIVKPYQACNFNSSDAMDWGKKPCNDEKTLYCTRQGCAIPCKNDDDCKVLFGSNDFKTKSGTGKFVCQDKIPHYIDARNPLKVNKPGKKFCQFKPDFDIKDLYKNDFSKPQAICSDIFGCPKKVGDKLQWNLKPSTDCNPYNCQYENGPKKDDEAFKKMIDTYSPALQCEMGIDGGVTYIRPAWEQGNC